MKYNDKIAVVTGASSGIGLELIRQLLDAGAKVWAVARNPEKIELRHPRLRTFAADLSREEEVDKLFGNLKAEEPRIDLFFANAGLGSYGTLDKPDWSQAENLFKINVISVIYSYEKMKDWMGSDPFRFVITASGVSLVPIPGYPIYAGTKFGIKGFGDAVRHELAPGQKLHLVYPVATKTAFFDRMGDTPQPWPRQTPQTVAKKILRGVTRGKNHIHPSALFAMALTFNRILPFILRVYTKMEAVKFNRYRNR